MAKKGQKQKKYSAEFKLCVILDMREHGLSYCETVRKYSLGNGITGRARAMLQRWEPHIFNSRFYGRTQRTRFKRQTEKEAV